MFSSKDVREFVESGVDYPVMIKALDGGGGRGIRVVKDLDGIEEAYKRSFNEMIPDSMCSNLFSSDVSAKVLRSNCLSRRR